MLAAFKKVASWVMGRPLTGTRAPLDSAQQPQMPAEFFADPNRAALLGQFQASTEEVAGLFYARAQELGGGTLTTATVPVRAAQMPSAAASAGRAAGKEPAEFSAAASVFGGSHAVSPGNIDAVRVQLGLFLGEAAALFDDNGITESLSVASGDAETAAQLLIALQEPELDASAEGEPDDFAEAGAHVPISALPVQAAAERDLFQQSLDSAIEEGAPGAVVKFLRQLAEQSSKASSWVEPKRNLKNKNHHFEGPLLSRPQGEQWDQMFQERIEGMVFKMGRARESPTKRGVELATSAARRIQARHYEAFNKAPSSAERYPAHRGQASFEVPAADEADLSTMWSHWPEEACYVEAQVILGGASCAIGTTMSPLIDLNCLLAETADDTEKGKLIQKIEALKKQVHVLAMASYPPGAETGVILSACLRVTRARCPCCEIVRNSQFC